MKNEKSRLLRALILLGIDEQRHGSNSVQRLLLSIRTYAKFVNDYEILRESEKLLSEYTPDVKYIALEHNKFLPMKYLPKRKRC